MINSPKKKLGLLLIGCFFIGFGAYRLVNHFIRGMEYSMYRLLLAVAFVGFGVFYLLRYFKK